jgi:chitinase
LFAPLELHLFIRRFSPAVATNDTRTSFVSSIVDIFTSHDLDGIDVDWEYPAQAGDGNEHDPKDTSNFLEFLRLLRASLPEGATISAAAQTVPFAGPDGSPMEDVKAFADVLDWILIMNYDTWACT